MNMTHSHGIAMPCYRPGGPELVAIEVIALGYIFSPVGETLLKSMDVRGWAEGSHCLGWLVVPDLAMENRGKPWENHVQSPLFFGETLGNQLYMVDTHPEIFPGTISILS